MSETQGSIAHYYHKRTKYDPQTIGSKSQGLDWERQPLPFKEYKIGTPLDLKPYLKDESEVIGNEPNRELRRLSRLLFCSYGLTARIPTVGMPIYLRAAPSAGGLYPAEIYLISRGTADLPPGLYNYQAANHSLVQFWQSQPWEALQAACGHPPSLAETRLAIVITAVFYRSAWRYQDRAYRRIFLDTGHLLGNIELASALNDYRPHLIGGFIDQQVNDLLYLDPQQEGAIAILPLVDLLEVPQGIAPGVTSLASPTLDHYPQLPDGELLAYLHQATQISDLSPLTPPVSQAQPDKYNFPFCLKVSTTASPIPWSDSPPELPLEALERTILKRRSTRAYSGADLTLEELTALLDFTYQPQHYVSQGLDGQPDYFDLSLIETFVAVSGVKGLEEGCYYYAPQAQELRQIRFKNFRRDLHYLCLGQELGRDAAAVLFHTADLQAAVAKYGDRVYRYLHMDSGHLGQRLNLAAIHLGLGVSGIGGFYDDQVNELLGIPVSEAVLYITTLGRPRRT